MPRIVYWVHKLVCPTCGRTLREDRQEFAPDFGPPVVRCKKCKTVLQTRYKQWNQQSLWQKTVTILTFIGIPAVASLPMLFIPFMRSQYPDFDASICVLGTVLFLLGPALVAVAVNVAGVVRSARPADEPPEW
jgi:hypothetical protein